jgi:hypothetical protein
MFRLAGDRRVNGGRMVAEADAAALVADAAQALAARGHSPVIDAANSVRLVRLGALMLDGFGIGTGRETTEENDG